MTKLSLKFCWWNLEIKHFIIIHIINIHQRKYGNIQSLILHFWIRTVHSGLKRTMVNGLSSLFASCSLLHVRMPNLISKHVQIVISRILGKRVYVYVFWLLSYFVLDFGLALMGLDLASFYPHIQKQALTLTSICPPNLSSIKLSPSCFVFGFGKMGLGWAEQHCTFCLQMSRLLF